MRLGWRRDANVRVHASSRAGFPIKPLGNLRVSNVGPRPGRPLRITSGFLIVVWQTAVHQGDVSTNLGVVGAVTHTAKAAHPTSKRKPPASGWKKKQDTRSGEYRAGHCDQPQQQTNGDIEAAQEEKTLAREPR